MAIPLDPWAYAALLVAGLLVLCVAVIVALRDRSWAAPRRVSRWVWCPQHERAVMVDFSERMETGMLLRSVDHCPVRRPDERCGDLCILHPLVSIP